MPDARRDRVADAAAAAATQAFKSWRVVPAPLRGELLYKVGDILKPKKEELAQLLTRDMGKVIAEARGDVQEAIDMAYFMGGEGRRLLGYTAPVEMPNKFGMAVRDPSGVVGLITPWNFPIAVPSWKIFPALMAGNTVIYSDCLFLLVILIGFATLSIAGFWAIKTTEAYLRDFCILYALFTLVLVVMLLKKYLFLNVENYSVRWWYFISGVLQLVQG